MTYYISWRLFSDSHTQRHTHILYIKHLPFSATPLRLIAIMASLMSSSEVTDESTLTTSKSTGTQQNLIVRTDGDHCSTSERVTASRLLTPFQHCKRVCVCVISHRNSSRTWLASSGPIPSPGIRVTVCLPPYWAGGGYNECTYTNTESRSPRQTIQQTHPLQICWEDSKLTAKTAAQTCNVLAVLTTSDTQAMLHHCLCVS